MKDSRIPVIVKEQGTGKNKDATIYSPVIFPNKEEADKFTVAITGAAEKLEKK